ncbi:hypothetical protein [Kitasatospora sp. NPDC059327]|uniref:competence protein CoiA family protein n=1 Tax=Kitasatospora sp. NPDC059327 TaxID=3346803 RepID=UPI0036CAC8C7
MGDETTAPWVYDRVTKWWVDLSQGVAGLEPGLADNRYVCRACRESLILRSARPGAVNSPHFSHKAGTECSAAPTVREQLELDDRIVIEFQRRITRAWPGMHCVLEVPVGLDGGAEGPAGVLPPAVVVRGGHDDGDVVVVERPRRPVGVGEVQERIRVVRARYGGGARHVWFWSGDALHAARLADLPVAPRGRPKTRHATIAPTEQQLAVIADGGRVYFLDGQQVLVPYGVHDFTHEQRAGEDWDFPDWRRDFRQDWRISRPVPVAHASRWGLAPVAFEELTRTCGVFTLSAANDLMLALEQSQGGRWSYRRTEAGKLYRERHQPVLPTAPAPDPEPAPVPEPVQETEPEPVPAREDVPVPPVPTTPQASTAPADALPGPVPDPTPAEEQQRARAPELTGPEPVEDSVYLLAPAQLLIPPRPTYEPTAHLTYIKQSGDPLG